MRDVRFAFGSREPTIEGPAHLCIDPGWAVNISRAEAVSRETTSMTECSAPSGRTVLVPHPITRTERHKIDKQARRIDKNLGPNPTTELCI
jgi:hypothetical protein